jgi:hypothetical protein
MASLLDYTIKQYPTTGAARYWISIYNWSKIFDAETPNTIKIYSTYQVYGGPEEGGWWYERGEALATHCIFSKKQCIKRCIELTEEYDLSKQPCISDGRNLTSITAVLGTGYALDYPAERPHYC